MVSNVSNEATLNSKRLYQVWQGRNKFFCGGRMIFGPDFGSLFLSMLLIAGPSIIFCIQVTIKIINRANTDSTKEVANQNEIIGVPVLLVAVIVTVAVMVFLLLTSSRDPGIIPRNAHPPESDESFDVTTPSMEWINGTAPHLRLPRTKDVVVNGFTVKVKYCDTCLLYRPPRASHCSICNNCVQKFDHHCPWVGQCIGLRNYRFFFMFISSSTFLCMYVFTFSWLNVIEEKMNHDKSLMKSLTDEILSLILIVYTFITVWFVGGLTVFHLYLISTNQTTYENFRYRYDKKENPFNKGTLGNFKHVFFSKIAPSLIDFRSWALEDPAEVESIAPADEIDMFFSKEDIEKGKQSEFTNNTSMPDILKNLDYSVIEDHLKENGTGHENDENVPFAFPIFQESIQTPGDPNQFCIAVDGRLVDGSVDRRNYSSGMNTSTYNV